jgi:tRNA (adenine37-N6)-methyltransferase
VAETLEMKIIARIHTDLPTKFGVPRQSGVVEELMGKIVFEPEYRNPDALRGMEGFSHLWLIWQFSQAVRENWSPTVRPPRLGGNTRMGVFATRSPFRPNAIGLSSVKLERVEPHSPDGPIIVVSGIDLMDGTPILDIKPYIPYADSHPQAKEGFTSAGWERTLEVNFPQELQKKVDADRRAALVGVLQNDPRPPYQNNPERVYGLPFGGQEIHFKVADGMLTVIDIEDKK